jgi:hypothetical protein
MAVDQEKMMQAIYDKISDILTMAPSMGMAGRPAIEPENTFVTLAFPGLPVDVSQFDNAWSPSNPDGEMSKVENFAWFVDQIPKMQAIYATSELSVDKLYGQIVQAKVVPEEPDPATEQVRQEAEDFLFTDGRVPSPIHQNYLEKQNSYATALMNYMDKYMDHDFSKPRDQRKWALLGPALQVPVDQAWDAFRTAAGEVEEKLAILRQVRGSNVPKIFSQAAKQYDKTTTASLIDGGSKWHQGFAIPGNWFAESAVNNFTHIKLKSESYYRSERSKFSSWSGNTGLGWGLWSFSGGSSGQSESHDIHRETEELEVAFKLGRVTIHRPWLDASLFHLPRWSVGGVEPGGYSTGKIGPNNDGMFALLPTAFMVARDIEISAQWSESDRNYAERAVEHKTGGGWGPFRVSGKYHSRTESRSFRSEFDGTTISVPGIQVIAWVNSVLPFCPPRS